MEGEESGVAGVSGVVEVGELSGDVEASGVVTGTGSLDVEDRTSGEVGFSDEGPAEDEDVLSGVVTASLGVEEDSFGFSEVGLLGVDDKVAGDVGLSSLGVKSSVVGEPPGAVEELGVVTGSIEGDPVSSEVGDELSGVAGLSGVVRGSLGVEDDLASGEIGLSDESSPEVVVGLSGEVVTGSLDEEDPASGKVGFSEEGWAGVGDVLSGVVQDSEEVEEDVSCEVGFSDDGSLGGELPGDIGLSGVAEVTLGADEDPVSGEVGLSDVGSTGTEGELSGDVVLVTGSLDVGDPAVGEVGL